VVRAANRRRQDAAGARSGQPLALPAPPLFCLHPLHHCRCCPPLASAAGKTLLARAVANRTDACFIRVIGSELVQKYVGEGARMVSGCCCSVECWALGLLWLHAHLCAPNPVPALALHHTTFPSCWQLSCLLPLSHSAAGVTTMLTVLLYCPAVPPPQVRELFQMARSKKACIIFFDEVRSLPVHSV